MADLDHPDDTSVVAGGVAARISQASNGRLADDDLFGEAPVDTVTSERDEATLASEIVERPRLAA
ncbi:hypothetical protein [Sphingomonas sp.]|uniref:hypothetical protein n=1 Tax=Sphingomonas sp. TaxID=28214 RepID=UPI0035C7C342